jgi:hypothetical protein
MSIETETPRRAGLRTMLAAILCGSVCVAHAQDPDPLGEVPGCAPRLMKVASPGKLHFVKDGHGCPSTAPACVASAFLLPGDKVVAMASSHDWVQAIFTGGPPHYLSTGGWLPRSALAIARGDEASRSPALPGAWVGSWHLNDGKDGTGQDIGIRASTDRRLEVKGAALALVGTDHFPRTGDFDTTLALSGAEMTFSPGPKDGAPAVIDPSLQSSNCVLRLRLLGPYLLVADNALCGGLGVTFAGVYRRQPGN